MQNITLHAVFEPTGDVGLLQLAIALRQDRIVPRSVVWTCGETGDVQITLTVDEDQRDLDHLVERLREIPGVRKIGPVDASPREAALPPNQVPPFVD